VKIVLKHTKKNDKTYKLPTAEELAVIIPFSNESCDIHTRDIVIYTRSNRNLQRINELHSSYDPLHYVLLFMSGESGWEPVKYRRFNLNNQQSSNVLLDESIDQCDIEQTNDKNEKCITARQFYSFILHERDSNNFNFKKMKI
jgi:hypothetical protein